jgi:putative glycosyltransferase (TIGR04372 family)
MRAAIRRLHIRARLIAVRARDEGVAWTTAQAFLRLARLLAWLALLPVALLLHLAGWRRLPVLTGRIGHLASEPDCFLKLAALGRVRRRRWFIAAPPGEVANPHMLAYWRPHLRVIDQPLLAVLIRTACRPPLATLDIAEYILTHHGPNQYSAVCTEWEPRAPLLSLSDEDRKWGRSMLAELGVPREAWFVCVHSRAAGFSPQDDKVHAHRNATLSHLIPALSTVVERGGWCVLMGHPSAPTLPPQAGVVDYAHHPLRSPRADVVLSAMCRFFLGSSSGLFSISTAFGIPVGLANVVPLTALPYAPNDFFVPKLYRSARDGRILRFDEILSSLSADYRHRRMYADAGLELIESSPEDIADLVEDLIDPPARQSPDPFHSLLRPHHYGYASRARLSPRFLARHAHLIL